MVTRETDFPELEERLRFSLSPISPRTEFVDRLGHRLTNPPAVVLETGSKQSAALVLIFGLLFGVSLLWMLRRLR